MILGKKQVNHSEEFFVLEKGGQFLYSIKDAHEKRLESGPFEDGLVWTESNDDRLELVKLEYDFLSDWNIVRVKLETVKRYSFDRLTNAR